MNSVIVMECEICNKQISETSKSHRIWHMDCFKCKQCDTALLDNFECHNGLLFCTQRCYKTATSKVPSKKFDTNKKFPYNTKVTFSAKDLRVRASETSTSQASGAKIYEARSGVINLGPEYEYKITTLLSLRLVSRNLEEFWLASNVRDVGSFDDIIIYTKVQNEEPIIYMIQLKHQEKPRNIDRQAFTASSGDFSVLKYSSDIQTFLNVSHSFDIQHLLQTVANKNYIIYTNRDVDDKDSILQRNCDDRLKFLETHGQHSKQFRFNFSALNKRTNLTFDEQYGKDILLFANQVSVKDIDMEIWRAVHAIFKSKSINIDIISKTFTSYITDWARGNFDCHYLLTKAEVLSKLYHLYFTQFQIDLNEYVCNYDCVNDYSLWKEITDDKILTTIRNTSNFVIQYLLGYISAELKQHCNESVSSWLSTLSQYSLDSFYNDNDDCKFLMLKICGRKAQLTLNDIYHYLCVLKTLPLILKVNQYEEFASLVNIKQDSYKIIILYNCDLDLNAGFASLQDLSIDHCRKVLSKPFCLQGRSAKLSDCIDATLYSYVKCCDIINILSDNFNIGKSLTLLPESFVDITVTKTFLKTNIRDLFNESFIIDGVNAPHTSNNLAAHYLSTYNNDYYLWKYSSASSKELEDYMVEIEYDLKNGVSNEDFFGKTVLISAPPGMGKSVLMTYVSHHIPTTKWVIPVNLTDNQQYFKNELCLNADTSALKHIEYFEEATNSFLQVAIYNKFVSKQKIVVLLDGFDEVSITYKEAVTNLAKSLQNAGFQIWLTTRPVMKRHLEEELKTQAIKLKPFTPRNQALFLTKHFCANNRDLDGDCIGEFVKKLLASANKHLNYTEHDFTGIPLQITLLGNVFNDDCRKYVLSADTYTFNENFDLLYLYQNFVDKKLELLYQKFGGAALDARALFTEHHCQFALRFLFPVQLLNVLENKKPLDGYYKIKENKMLLMQREGIIVIDENFIINFTHRTYAEYLAANWIANNLIKKNKLFDLAVTLYKQRFTDGYRFLFRIFDQIVANNSALHVSIINGQCSAIHCYDGNDSIGRNFLHLVALYSAQFPLRNYYKHLSIKNVEEADIIENDSNSEIDCITSSFFKPDNIGYNPLDYALENRALTFAEKLCSNPSAFFSINVPLRMQYLEYCARFNYCALFKVLLPYSIKADILLRYTVSKNVQEYCRFYFEYNPHLVDNFAIEPGLFKLDQQDCDSQKFIGNYVANNVVSNIGDSTMPTTSKNVTTDELSIPIGENITHHWLNDKSACDILIKNFHDNYDINVQDEHGNTPLHVALRHKLDVADLLIFLGADSSVQNHFGETPLHIAAVEGLTDILTKLPHNCNVGNFSGDTPLHLAILNGKKDVVKVLLANNADTNLSNNAGNVALHLAQMPEIVELLTSKNVSINASNNIGETPLHVATYSNNVEIVKLLIAKGADVNFQSNNGETPLHAAAINDNDCVEVLVDSNANIHKRDLFGNTPLHYAVHHINLLCDEDNINSGNFEGSTPLHLACFTGNLIKIDQLIKKGADCGVRNKRGRMAFHCAVEMGYRVPMLNDINECDFKGNTPLHLVSNVNILNYLIENGADADTRNKDGAIPLHLATRTNILDVVKVLSGISNLNAQDCEGNTALHIAVRLGYMNMIDLLISKGADVNKPNKIGKTPLYFAPDAIVLKRLINQGALVNVHDLNGNTALHTASFCGQLETISLLLDENVDVNCQNKSYRTPLHFASAEGHVHCVSKLLTGNASIDSCDRSGNTPLHLAIWNIYAVEILISSGATIDISNENGQTPLHRACYECYPDVVHKLIASKADVNKPDKYGNTPLHLACSHIEIAHILISNNALVNLKNHNGETVLHLCTTSEIVNTLIDSGLSIDEQNNDGDTPLHYAAKANCVSILDLLLSKNAAPNPLNKKGETPLDYAFTQKHYDSIDKLIAAGVDVNPSAYIWQFEIMEYLQQKNHKIDANALLDYASQEISYWGIKHLLKAGLDVNKQNSCNNTLLHLSLLAKSDFCTNYLISKGANVNIPNNEGQTCIHLAASFLTDFDIILNNATNVNDTNNLGETPLHLASQCIEPTNVNKLIAKGADVNSETHLGETPLFYASERNLSILLNNGANINHRDKKGNTALHTAALNNKNKSVVVLLSEGADVNAKNLMEQTPLHLAVVCDNNCSVSLLIHNGADINVQDSLGNTALHISCQGGYYYCAEDLVKNGADINIQNKQGDTPLHSSMSFKGYYTIVELLVSSGAVIDIKNNLDETPLNIARKHGFARCAITLYDTESY